MEAFYRLILRKVVNITWKNKWLWPLAFFAAFIGNGGVYEALLRGFNNVSEGRSVFYTLQEYAQTGVWSMMSWSKFSALWQADASAFGLNLLGLVALFSVMALMVAIGVICQAGVVGAIVKLDEGENADMKKSFSAGTRHFWPVLELNVFTKVFLLGVLFFLAYLASLIVINNETVNTIIYVISFVVFVALGIIVYFLTIYGTAYIVLRNRNVFTAFKSAWHLFRSNVLLNLEMGLLLFLVNIVAAALFLIACFIVLSPLFLLYFLSLFSGLKIAAGLSISFALLIFIAATILGSAWWSAFQLGVWATLFEELEVKGGKSKIQRLFESAAKAVKRSK